MNKLFYLLVILFTVNAQSQEFSVLMGVNAVQITSDRPSNYVAVQVDNASIFTDMTPNGRSLGVQYRYYVGNIELGFGMVNNLKYDGFSIVNGDREDMVQFLSIGYKHDVTQSIKLINEYRMGAIHSIIKYDF